jgi:Mycobacterial cell wall arabinan synthesis protein
VTQLSRHLDVSVGGGVVTGLELPANTATASNCAYDIVLSGGKWSTRGGPGVKEQAGTTAMPIVDGLFSGLRLTPEGSPRVEITTTRFGSKTTLLQAVLRILGTLAAVVALILVAMTRPPRDWWRVSAGAVRAAAARASLADLTIGVLLVGWWLVGPAFFDDGWIVAQHQNFTTTGNFSSYYDSFGVTSSIQYWLEWVEHWLFRVTNSLLILRIPALLCLAATWVLCRWILARMSSAAARSRAAIWALAAAFAVGALAWGMTLRPEPVIALLATGVVACSIRLIERGTAAPLALAAVLIALAVAAHPAGLVLLAPLLVTLPALARWARTAKVALATIVIAGAALLGVLALLGSNLENLRSNTSSLRAYGAQSAGWRDELTRYELLGRPLYGAPLRREWVVLAFLTVVASLLRRRGGRARALLDLPAAALGLSAVILIVTPSKVPWHFGALIGVAAVAVGAEVARLVEDARATPGWHVRPFIVIGAAMVAAAWSWFPRNAWSDLDLRTLSWTLGVEQRVTFAKLAGLLPLLLLGALVALRRGRRVDDAAWRTAMWVVPVIAAPLILFTVGILVADAQKTSGWTLTRQNLDTLRDDLRCGLADDALVPAPPSMRALPSVGRAPAIATRDLPAAPVDVPRFVVGAAAPSPWFRLATSNRTGFFVTGDPGAGDSLEVEWGRVHGSTVDRLGTDGVPDASLGDPSPDLVAWRFYPAGSLPTPPANADAIRIVLRSDIAPGGSIGVTAPVSYEDESLATRLERSRPALALPNLRTYVPCIDQPTVAGTVEVPNLIVGQQGTLWPIGTGTSPFDGLPRVYNLVRLPLTDSPDPPGDVAIYEVDRRIPGGVLAPVS